MSPLAEDALRRDPKHYPDAARHHVEVTIDLVDASNTLRTRAKHVIEWAYHLGYDLVDLRTMARRDLQRIKNLGVGTLAVLARAGLIGNPAQAPTRRDLLLVIGELQDIIGKLGSTYQNDRGVERAKPIQDLVKRGMDLCIRARSFDPPLTGRWP